MERMQGGKPMSGNKTGKNGFASAKNPVFMIVVALALCIVSGLGGRLVKSGAGSIAIKELYWETPSGLMQSAQLYIPSNATAAEPSPGIVVTHGWQDGKDMQESHFIELSRRGYVVLSIDMYGHGDSGNVPDNSWWDDRYGGNGVYDGVKLLAALPYVDSGKIGISGHSNGAYASNVAVMLDNKAQTPLIAAVFLESNDAYYSHTPYYGDFYHGEDTNYTNVYGNRDVGISAAKYDEIMHRVRYEDGTVTSPGDFINQGIAQSFLHFGRESAQFERRDANTIYTETINGKEAFRVIYTPPILHAWGIISARLTSLAICFFQESIPAPNPIAPAHQIWQWKTVFGIIGIVGLFIFFVNFILAMLNTRFFGELRATGPVYAAEATKKGKVRFWRGMIISAIISSVAFFICFLAGALFRPAFFNQMQTYILGLWSVVSGLVALLFMRINYKRYSKANGLNLREQGVILSRAKLLKTILLGLLTAIAAYTIVFLSGYFFGTDFRFWILLKFRPFDSVKFAEIIKFLPFFLVYYVTNSVAVNVFNYIRIGKKEWVNTAIVSIFNAMGPALLVIFLYTYFFSTGLMPTDGLAWGLSSPVFWVYSLLVILPLSAVLSRIVYKATRNPYIHAIAYAAIITVMQCTNTLTTTF
jgi:hypothetical protein